MRSGEWRNYSEMDVITCFNCPPKAGNSLGYIARTKDNKYAAFFYNGNQDGIIALCQSFTDIEDARQYAQKQLIEYYN